MTEITGRRFTMTAQKYFNIVMTNPAFSYDRDTNVISVDPGTEPEQDGEMIITWKNSGRNLQYTATDHKDPVTLG